MTRKVAFLDRDGTINVDRGYVYHVEEWQFAAGAIEAIALLHGAGYAIAIVTNQSAIAAGKYTLGDVEQLHEHLRSQLTAANCTIDAIAVCPHSPDDNCDCRKPRTGMAKEIERQLGTPIDYVQSWTIGDKLSDMGFGRNSRTKTALLTSPYWQLADLPWEPDLIASSLWQAALAIRRVLDSDLNGQ